MIWPPSPSGTVANETTLHTSATMAVGDHVRIKDDLYQIVASTDGENLLDRQRRNRAERRAFAARHRNKRRRRHCSAKNPP